jgi:DNA-binding transcriptional LysR family regulator
VAEIERDMPALMLDITISLTAQLLQNLLGATSDLVFLAGPVASPGLQTASIGAVELQWLASPATAQAMRKGAVPPIWSLPRQSPLHQVMLETLAGETLPAIRTCNNARMLIDIIIAGQGMALLPETMTRDAVTGGRLQEVWPGPSAGSNFRPPFAPKKAILWCWNCSGGRRGCELTPVKGARLRRGKLTQGRNPSAIHYRDC